MPQLQFKEHSKSMTKLFSPTDKQFFSLFFWLQVSADMQNMLQSKRSEITMEQDQGTSVFKDATSGGGGQPISIALR